MCGFSGVLFHCANDANFYTPGRDGFRWAAAQIAHRGDTDYQERFEQTVWMAHHRLAFQDVTSGIQPMLSQDQQLQR